MLKALVLKNLKGQYRNSYLGFLWQFVTPVVSVMLFYIVFTSLRVNPMEDYWAYLCAGMFPFTFMNSAITGGSSCIAGNSSMVKKMYFPREILVFASVISSLITFIISYAVVIILMLICNTGLGINLIFVIPLMVLSILFNAGVFFLLSSISVYARDFGYFINAFSRVMFWVTPVFYTVDSLTGLLAKVVWINPLTWFIDSYQKVAYYNVMPPVTSWVVCVIMSIAMLLIGWMVFNRLNRGFAERV